MGWLGWLLALSGLAVGGLVLAWAISSGKIWDGIVRFAVRQAKAIFFAMLPGILKILKPASPEEQAALKRADDRGNERDRLNKGSGRPFGRGKE